MEGVKSCMLLLLLLCDSDMRQGRMRCLHLWASPLAVSDFLDVVTQTRDDGRSDFIDKYAHSCGISYQPMSMHGCVLAGGGGSNLGLGDENP
jgi:hypothetical protein